MPPEFFLLVMMGLAKPVIPEEELAMLPHTDMDLTSPTPESTTEAGFLPYQVPVRSLDEVGQLAVAFNKMAESRMQAEAEELEAEGIVGVQLNSLAHRWGGHTTEFFAIGTAVRPLRPERPRLHRLDRHDRLMLHGNGLADVECHIGLACHGRCCHHGGNQRRSQKFRSSPHVQLL